MTGETYEITLITIAITGTGSVQVKSGNTFGTVRTTNATFTETLVCTNTGFAK